MQTMRRAGCGWFTTILGPVSQIMPTISTSTSYATVRPTIIGSASSTLSLRPCRTKMPATPLAVVGLAMSKPFRLEGKRVAASNVSSV